MLGFPTGSPVHATAIVVGETGLLITGPSGTGKSLLALRCLAAARAGGHHAALVADDSVILDASGGRVVMRCPPPIAGLAEIRGTGLVEVAYRNAALLSRVVAPGEPAGATRLPPAGETAEIGGVRVPVTRFFYVSTLDPMEILLPAGLFARIVDP